SLNHSETTISYAAQQGYTNAGSYTIIASAAATSNYLSASTSISLQIDKATQTIVFNEIPTKSLENDVDFQLNAIASSGLPVSYSFTYSSDLPAATVSATGFVELLSSGVITITASQVGDNNYLPMDSVERDLKITSANASIYNVTIGGQTFDSPDAQIYYLIDCGNYVSSVDIAIDVDANAVSNVGTNFSIETLTPGVYRSNIVINSQDGTQTKNYEVLVEKAFQFEDIIEKKYNNTLVVNNNPATNGGYSFVSYKWFKNGQLVSEKQFYSEGNNADDQLDPNATYQAVMITENGDELRTCVAQVELETFRGLTILQNPVTQGNKLNVRVDYPKEELKNAIFQIFDLNGRLITTLKVTGINNSIELPASISNGVYSIVVITSKNRDFKRFIYN
ncbi:T9SS type A sorting domain-containing protein, partial [Polaribacter sp. MSW13]